MSVYITDVTPHWPIDKVKATDRHWVTIVCSVVATDLFSCPRAAKCTMQAQQCALPQGRPGWRAGLLGHLNFNQLSFLIDFSMCALLFC